MTLPWLVLNPGIKKQFVIDKIKNRMGLRHFESLPFG
jgi:hypothetical protein